jgi:hypothetical protein
MKINNQDLYEAIGEISSDKITTAEDYRPRLVITRWQLLAPVAACFAIIAIAAALILPENGIFSGNRDVEKGVYFDGVVTRISGSGMLVDSEEVGLVSVSIPESGGEVMFYVGDTVKINHCGMVLDSFPVQLVEVYSVNMVSRDRRPGDYFAVEWTEDTEGLDESLLSFRIAQGYTKYAADLNGDGSLELIYITPGFTSGVYTNMVVVHDFANDEWHILMGFGRAKKLSLENGKIIVTPYFYANDDVTEDIQGVLGFVDGKLVASIVTDITGDGKCDFIFMTAEESESTDIYNWHINVYDQANDEWYFMTYARQTVLFVQNGKIMVAQYDESRRNVLGELILANGELVIIGMNKYTPFDYWPTEDAPIPDGIYLGMPVSLVYEMFGAPDYQASGLMWFGYSDVGIFDDMGTGVIRRFNNWNVHDLVTIAVIQNYVVGAPTGIVHFESHEIIEFNGDESGFTVRVLSLWEGFLPDGQNDVQRVVCLFRDIEITFAKVNGFYSMTTLNDRGEVYGEDSKREVLENWNTQKAMNFFISEDETPDMTTAPVTTTVPPGVPFRIS